MAKLPETQAGGEQIQAGFTPEQIDEKIDSDSIQLQYQYEGLVQPDEMDSEGFDDLESLAEQDSAIDHELNQGVDPDGFSVHEDRPALQDVQEFLNENLEDDDCLHLDLVDEDAQEPLTQHAGTNSEPVSEAEQAYYSDRQSTADSISGQTHGQFGIDAGTRAQETYTQAAFGQLDTEREPETDDYTALNGLPVRRWFTRGSGVAAASYCGALLCFGFLAWSNYDLHLENQALRTSVENLENKVNSAKPLYQNTNRRLDVLNLKISELDESIGQINDQNYAMFVSAQPDYLPTDYKALSNLTLALQKKIDLLAKQEAKIESPMEAALPAEKQSETFAEQQAQQLLVQADQASMEVKQQQKNGKWIVNLVSFRNQGNADKLQKQMQAKSIPVEKQTTKLNGKPIYRLRVSGFQSKKEADRFGSNTIKKLNLKSYWITT